MTLLLALALGDAQAIRLSVASDVTPWCLPWPDGSVYLEPYAAAGPLVPLTPEPTLGGETWSEPWVQAIGTVHLGWRFDGGR